MQGRPPLLANGDLAWDVNTLAQITPRTDVPGFSHVRVGDRAVLHQAMNLPQLSRAQGWLIYLLSTGQFSLRGARGCLTNMRVLELRNARETGHTGNVATYNMLASSLPQDTRVYFQR